MSNIMKELKAEISRLARKEVNRALAPVRKITAGQRSLIAGLRRQIAALQTECKVLRRAVPAAAAPATDEPPVRFWITGKGVKSLRRRLGLTQAGLARLAGVSVPAVVNWEKNSGKIRLRKITAAALQDIRRLTKRSAAERLGAVSRKTRKAGKPARG